jgi:hypothetical protein
LVLVVVVLVLESNARHVEDDDEGEDERTLACQNPPWILSTGNVT